VQRRLSGAAGESLAEPEGAAAGGCQCSGERTSRSPLMLKRLAALASLAPSSGPPALV